MVPFLVWGVWDWILKMMNLFQPLRLPNTFLGGGCPNTFQRPWLMEVCLGGPQTPMYSQGIRKTSDMFFGRLMMFNERRQLDITKPPLEMMLQRVPRKRSPETNWANFAGFWLHIHFWGKRCGWSCKRKYCYAQLVTIGYRHLFANMIELIYPSFNKKEPRWTIPWPLVLGLSENG